MSENLCLKIENLSIDFRSRAGVSNVVNNMSLEVNKAQTVGIVGESGCGKTMTALAAMGLIPSTGRAAKGKILLNNENILEADEKRWRKIRGKKISMIFQEPMTSLNPVFSVGAQIVEMLNIHESISKNEAWDRAVEMLKTVGIKSPERRVKSYPHELSGGQRQRVMIAMALICEPEVLIADEPTTALDVTVQAKILDQLKELQEKTKTSIILITHDMGVIAETVSKVAVMYAGCKLEEGQVADVIRSPLHPYTQGLISCIPVLNPNMGKDRPYLVEIPGTVPDSISKSNKCPFLNRCAEARKECFEEKPPVKTYQDNHTVACWLNR